MTKECYRCKLTDVDAPIHEHHKNGNHFDDRPENKMFLCANCHMMLHWKRWKLSDIGLEDVLIVKTTKYQLQINNLDIDELEEQWLNRKDLLNHLKELEEENKALLYGLSYYHDNLKFHIEESHYHNLEVSKITREEGYPWVIRNKIIKFESDANTHRIKEWQNLNVRFNNFRYSWLSTH
jgi:regulator of replication initiation timing